MDISQESSPQSKRHSFPAILTYSETLSVLSEHQRQYNDRELSRRCNTPTFNCSGSDEERRRKIQQALEWLRLELKDMYHQDKFLLRQFNHLNRSIQDLKDKQEIPEVTDEQDLRQDEPKSKATKEGHSKQKQTRKGQVDKTQPKKGQREAEFKVEEKEAKQQQREKVNSEILMQPFKLEDLEQARVKQAQLRKEQMRQEELKLEDSKQEKRSLNEYDSDYGSDQSMDKFEEDCQSLKNIVILTASPTMAAKQRTNKRWTWWK